MPSAIYKLGVPKIWDLGVVPIRLLGVYPTILLTDPEIHSQTARHMLQCSAIAVSADRYTQAYDGQIVQSAASKFRCLPPSFCIPVACVTVG